MNPSKKVMVGEIPKLCLLVATLAVGSAAGACERGRTWWDRERGVCVNCTRCEPLRLAVKVPCELHRDTICQPLHEINIFDISTTDNEPSDKFSEIEYYEDYTNYYGEVSEDESEKWNLQATTLSLAICGCVLFFVVVLYSMFHHSKQWKVLKQALKTDVQDLSAKLKLMEAGETPAEPVVPADHHIYCNIHVGPSNKKGLGNVYTQEIHST